MLTTLLGSCVAACLRDPVARIGGMNHFLLPGQEAGEGAQRSVGETYGVHLMELLVNGLLRRGARRDRLEGKLFGGARTMDGLADMLASASALIAFVGIAVDVVCSCMALLPFVESAPRA